LCIQDGGKFSKIQEHILFLLMIGNVSDPHQKMLHQGGFVYTFNTHGVSDTSLRIVPQKI